MYQIIYIPSNEGLGAQRIWPYRPKTLDEALRVGHELTRDYVAHMFVVRPVKLTGTL